MKPYIFVASVLLSACNGSPSQAPATSLTAADSPGADTLKKRPVPRPAVPFVNPTKLGRALGEKTPSPPASRTR